MKHKKLYFVKREVLATSIERAMKAPGVIYAIEEAADSLQPIPKNKPAGFKIKK